MISTKPYMPDKLYSLDKPNKFLGLLLLWGLLFSTLNLSAQSSSDFKITIGGNVYGGGNEGNVDGNTTVTVKSSEIHGNIFGGARMADVGGRAFVHIDGANTTGGEIMIKNVYGGNDIAGTVGKHVNPAATTTTALPAQLTEVGTAEGKNDINDSWAAFVRTSKMPTEDIDHRIIVGTIFGGGNGDYNYFEPGDVTGQDGEGHDITATQYEIRDKSTGDLIAQSDTAFTKPTLTKTYLELLGGCLAHVYGGGNNVTVTQNTTLCINNTSLGLQQVLDASNPTAEFQQLAKFVDLSTFQGNYSSLDFTFARIFGGNNKAEMKIMPIWNIQRGRIRDLYSGGNEGNMTSEYGILLDVKPLGTPAEAEAGLLITNVYGGCRRADVDPRNNLGQTPATIQLPADNPRYNTYKFPAGLSARTIVRGGHIVNVYGGNDISGHIFGGDAVGIYCTVYGDVYGAGNGSYSYTDNAALGALNTYKDYYYNPAEVKAKERQYNNPAFDYSSTDPAVQSVEALNLFRPNAEQISIRLAGSEARPTYIKGAVYLGGNSATLRRKGGWQPGDPDPLVELKIGSHVIVDKMFLGNNGENMVTEEILHRYAGYQNTATGATVDSGTSDTDFSQMDLTVASTFAKYMDGCAMELKPRVVFDLIANNDQEEYEEYSSKFGSFFCGGNRGSMTWEGTNTIDFNRKVIIFDKFVGGCNNANITATTYNAAYDGGMIGTPSEQGPMGMKNPDGSIKDCLILNLRGLKILPKRWKDATDPTKGLEWNTIDYIDGHEVANAAPISGTLTIDKNDSSQEAEWGRRLKGGNIYGGCYESGCMNGNVVINILDDIVDLTGDYAVFDVVDEATHNPILYENNTFTITKRNSGVILDEQGMDPLGSALNVFGAGFGDKSEVWGSTTINLKKGFVFQIFGGGEMGIIGQAREDFTGTSFATVQATDQVINGKHYFYDPRFSTYINLNDTTGAVGSATSTVARTIFTYGGSFQALIAGNTRINMGNCRVFNTFAGSCNADILGHTETYMGNGLTKEGTAVTGFPYVEDHIYGGNDLGGRILGSYDFTSRVGTTNGQDLTKVYQYDASSNPSPFVLNAGAYIEYTQGRVLNIFGGAYGDYDYTDPEYRPYCNADGSNKPGFSKPRLGNAFINFKPISNASSSVAQLYGAGQGCHYVFDRDVMQERSYILIDIPQEIQQFKGMVAFGAGAYSGLGLELDTAAVNANPDIASAVIDLARGQIKNVYGGSYKEGVTRRTVVNVPVGSTIAMTKQMDNEGHEIANSGCIFGGAFGEDISYPCDVIESHVNYSSNDATVQGGIFGGNNNARRTFFTNVSINSTVYSNKARGYQGYVYGGGFGEDSWAHYTNVHLNNGAVVYKLYGGGSAGRVLNEYSLAAWNNERISASQTFDLSLGGDYTGNGYTVNLDQNPLAPWNELAEDIGNGIVKDRGNGQEKYNTNVHIHTGATVTGYAYGGGYGPQAAVSGDTYIALVGGRAEKDIYAAGESGPVMCLYPAAQSQFRACANAYIRSGRVRNVYGGGWKGDVGYHGAGTLEVANDDVEGLTNVVIGTLTGTCLNNGIPTVERNAYGGGEGGAIYGTAYVSMNNGYIGYRYDGSDPTTFVASDYVEELDDMANADPERRVNGLLNSGNIFGGGYVANSYTEHSNVFMYKGVVRGSVYGGGEIGPIGRGTVKAVSSPIENHNAHIFKPGSTQVYIYGGLVQRNVFGGGRGYDNWGGDGTELYKDQPEILAQMDLESKGFVFGETSVHIYGGTIGTPATLELGHGNVFGGGDIGFVYSGHGKLFGTRGERLSTTDGLPENGGGYYYKYYNDNLTNVGNFAAAKALGMTMDCSVEVAPYCLALSNIDFDELQTDANGKFVLDSNTGLPIKTGSTVTFNAGEYVPYEYLNLLRNRSADAAKWAKLDISGVLIRNAVFAGGNVSTGSDQIFVNTNTVYGNASAALRDVYHRDLITVGTEHIGGLYGDGNLTFVDGFRELHIANYGTDFYGMSDEITKAEYDALSDRERAYFELQYECIADCTDKNGHEYHAGNKLSLAEFKDLFEGTQYINQDDSPNASYWTQMGVCTIYAGRLLNTVQRADFVGIWGSRLVLQGARDRVPEVADYTNYTINRVNEVSLNKMDSQISTDTGDDASHGNYFGIYSIVNYMGNLTSDNFFDNVRTTSTTNPSLAADGTTSYYNFKLGKLNDRYRNNATSWNKVALASGVYLELVNEPTSASTEKDWGYVTGVIELDLINVKQGLGGGYVYAKNEHGMKTHHTDWSKVTLTPYNKFARTYRRFTYTTDDASKIAMETSGNFVHNVKQIVDDCYPTHNKYLGTDASPAHYWYIKGSIYVYDQYISAYTGSATSYAETVSIPLSIMAGAHGRLTLREVQPSLYAYYDKNGNKLGSANADETLEINGKHYELNEPITYWDWSMLTTAQQAKFVGETYTVVEKCKINNVEYPVGYTMLPNDYESLKNGTALAYDADNDTYVSDPDKDATFFLRPSNNVSHDKGYTLTFDMDNPMVWNDYYTKTTALTDKVNTKEYQEGKKADDTAITTSDYTQGPTYHLNGSAAAVYGQKYYEVNDIIDNTIYDTYQTLPASALAGKGTQAVFEEAWVTTQAINVNGATINPGVAITQSEYAAYWGTTIKPTGTNANVVTAKVITSTLQLAESEYLYAGDILSEAEIKAQIQSANPSWTETQVNTFYDNNSAYIAKAYYCTSEGNYGGKLYHPNTAYETLDAWCAMSDEDRANFSFNYDALDLLVDPTYGGSYGYKPQYDGYAPGSSQSNVEGGTASAQYANCTPLNPPIYSKTTSVDYIAVCDHAVSYNDANNQSVSISVGDTLTREEYEKIPNEKYHYSPIDVTSPGTYYVVQEAFIRGDLPYSVGDIIAKAQYDALDDNQKVKIDVLNFTSAQAGSELSEYVDDSDHTITDDRGFNKKYSTVMYYYCRDPYTIGLNGEGEPVSDVMSATPTQYGTSSSNMDVPLGVIIDATNYGNLPNKTVVNDHQAFSIIGNIPLETSTLYVARESDIYDLSKEKVITVIYLYEYEESDETGTNIQPISERHIVNVHLQFKSGVPQIGQLTKPNTVLPGSTVGMKVPEVTTGAFEILTSGWEVFANKEDAGSHKNGMPFVNNNTRVYWYQDNYQIAYYTKTYLGKTYSNYVPLSVGNYHDIADVMADKENHMYIDHNKVQRPPKIYIDNRNTSEHNTHKSELDLLKDLFDLTLQEKYDDHGEPLDSLHNIETGCSEIGGHNRVDPDQIGAAKNLEFFLRDNVAPKYYTNWTSIGDVTQDGTGKFTNCFDGVLHGDGYTISGLNNSLFKSLCGEVYNLGVTGTFTSAGIVDTGTGYIENCWIKTEGTPVAGIKPLFDTPARDASIEGGKYAGKLIQVVNSYYPTENGYSFTADASHGSPIEKPLQSFFNGEVTYDLNGFYLNKRYYDHTSASGYDYKYLDSHDLDVNNKPTVKDGHYPVTNSFDYDYVYNRYSNVDFTFAGGTVPSSDNERLVEDMVNQSSYYCPIWPDDYLFFGQRLTYGYVDGRPHQEFPSYITKSSGRLETDGTISNRVYRAPAYFQSNAMNMAYYNPQAVFADHKNGDETLLVHRNMTAIDFTGSNGDVAGGYKLGLQTNGHFFPPLLDIDGLTAIRNEGLTKNWLVYTPDAIDGQADAADSQTNRVVLDYLQEYDFASNVTNATYRTVAAQDEEHQLIHGHAVVKKGTNSFSAPADRDHFLVDKQDFNAPIAYDIAAGHRMWYQRRPDNYVDRSIGWEGISIPFSAELVTTNQKGEITHFYETNDQSQKSKNGTDTKIGHEYWLREFKEGGVVSTTNNNIFEANFGYPSTQPAWADGMDKTYTNTFLWDYYYREASSARQDANLDTYQQDYYKEEKTYPDYAYSVAARPYLIGFPGTTYYEFDLSGGWMASNSNYEINKLGKQVITFASHEASSSKPLTIAVSDDEMATAAVTADGYTFWPNYLGKNVSAGAFMMKSDGSSYEVTSADIAGVPFRPYFAAASAPVKGIQEITFSATRASLGYEEEQQPEKDEHMTGELQITSKRGRIIVKSFMTENEPVYIVNAAGVVVRTFDIAPGETVETRVPTGIYVVNRKKVPVR